MTAVDTSKSSAVLVTGGTDGLGRATSLLLASEGYRVFAGGRNAHRRAALDVEANDRNLPLATLELDVTDDESVNRAVAEIEQQAGPVEILINNAGIAIGAVVEEISLADLRKQFDTNYFAIVRLSQRVLPAMRERRRGRIINMSSVAGLLGSPVMGPYSSSKHALEGLSDSMRFELIPFGIHVILIEPGFIPTNIENAATQLSSAYVTRAQKSPYRMVYEGFRTGWAQVTKNPKYTPDDCARVILRAIRDTPPRARYPVTSTGHAVRWMKRIFSDRMLDRMITKQYRIRPPQD
ncbi:MAG TPA: SDR family oxidoreductase [Candidatus Acidoferrales bacterium]|nr:SDR family oxidoreductase [Candidatus Acidoferrales bacterium]